MESLDQTKTHLELKKMIAEVDRENRGAISYNDFLYMMLGKSTSVLKKVLKFTEKMKPKEYPKGIPPKRDLFSPLKEIRRESIQRGTWTSPLFPEGNWRKLNG